MLQNGSRKKQDITDESMTDTFQVASGAHVDRLRLNCSDLEVGGILSNLKELSRIFRDEYTTNPDKTGLSHAIYTGKSDFLEGDASATTKKRTLK